MAISACMAGMLRCTLSAQELIATRQNKAAGTRPAAWWLREGRRLVDAARVRRGRAVLQVDADLVLLSAVAAGLAADIGATALLQAHRRGLQAHRRGLQCAARRDVLRRDAARRGTRHRRADIVLRHAAGRAVVRIA